MTKNPNDVDITLSADAKSRSAEIVNAYLKAIGLKLTFEKVPKKYQEALLYDIPDEDFYTPAILEDYSYLRALRENDKSKMTITVKEFNGKYYPVYENFVEPGIPALMEGAISNEPPEGYSETDSLWVTRGIKYFNR